MGLKSRLPIPMGVPYTGGSIVTRGGLIFMGGTMDRHLRAFDVRTGEVLWSDVLPNNAQATPITYLSPRTGKQYLVLAVPAVDAPQLGHRAESGTGATKSQGGGWLIAYALPEADTR